MASSAPITPQEFICPLSHQLMTDPVISIHGETFQRDAILNWFDMDNDYCPFSGKPLSLQDIIPNYSLRAKIHMWIEKNGLKEIETYQDDGLISENDDENDDASIYIRKLGISSREIEIDTQNFNSMNLDDEPPVSEIFCAKTSSDQAIAPQRFRSLRKALKKFNAKAA